MTPVLFCWMNLLDIKTLFHCLIQNKECGSKYPKGSLYKKESERQGTWICCNSTEKWRVRSLQRKRGNINEYSEDVIRSIFLTPKVLQGK